MVLATPPGTTHGIKTARCVATTRRAASWRSSSKPPAGMHRWKAYVSERLFGVLLWVQMFIVAKSLTDDFKSAFSDCGEMVVTQDSPATLDMPVTFDVNLTCALEGQQYMYIFEDNVIPPHRVKLYGNRSISLSLIYPENIYRPGQYVMTVTCNILVVKSLYAEVGTKNVSFILTEYIPGNVSFTGVVAKYDKLYAATDKVVNITVNLHYPDQTYKVSELSYLWSVGRDQFISAMPYLSYSFTRPSVYYVHVAVVARIPVYNASGSLLDIKYKWGSFDQEINAKDPFQAINLTGNTYLQHGQLFNLNVSCNGSGPFEYCWKVLQPSENLTKLTCLAPVITNQCSFPIIYYFHQPGDYEVAIHIDNFVTEMQRNVEVHIYDVERRAQLSTVIIPLSCSVLVVLIIAAGVMLHVRRNQKLDVETADFDFLQSDTYVIETFWERLYHSILSTLWICRRFSVPPYLCLTNTENSSPPNQYDSTNHQ